MYETLKALSIRLDSPAQTLTKDAIAQLLIKIIYSNPNSMTRAQILDSYKRIVGWDDARRDEINHILDSLKNTEIQYNKGNFYLSKTKRESIDQIKLESENRFNNIIERYIKSSFSSREAVKNWLQDALITFFSSYSREWIADLCSNQSAVQSSIPRLIEQIKSRTIANKQICKEDRTLLLEAFENILTKTDPEIDSLLWEYGTAQFSSQLLKNGRNIDKLAVDTFSEAVCILDTNILFHLSLPGNDYSKHLSALEKIFSSLGIKVRYLYITRQEYINTVSSKSNEVLKLLDTFEVEVVAEVAHPLVVAANKLHCSKTEDYERFFKQISNPPTVIDKTVMISLLDDDIYLHEAITTAQNNEEKLSHLNSVHRAFTGRDKREHALVHDVGIIAGVDYLRRTGAKYFILSQDSSIINYAKNYPFLHGLPIAIKIETLLNVLAVNSYTSSTESYESLFASMIRQGLQPKSNAFTVEDLHYIMEKEQFVAQLPTTSVISILKEVSYRRLLGEDNETINKELTRKVQGEKLRVAADLQNTKLLLNATQHNANQLSKQNIAVSKAYQESLRKEKNQEINQKIRNQIWSAVLAVTGLTLLIGLIVAIKHILVNKDNLGIDITIGIITDCCGSCWAVVKGFMPTIRKLRRTRAEKVEEYVASELKKLNESMK